MAVRRASNGFLHRASERSTFHSGTSCRFLHNPKAEPVLCKLSTSCFNFCRRHCYFSKDCTVWQGANSCSTDDHFDVSTMQDVHTLDWQIWQNMRPSGFHLNLVTQCAILCYLDLPGAAVRSMCSWGSISVFTLRHDIDAWEAGQSSIWARAVHLLGDTKPATDKPWVWASTVSNSTSLVFC